MRFWSPGRNLKSGIPAIGQGTYCCGINFVGHISRMIADRLGNETLGANRGRVLWYFNQGRIFYTFQD